MVNAQNQLFFVLSSFFYKFFPTFLFRSRNKTKKKPAIIALIRFFLASLHCSLLFPYTYIKKVRTTISCLFFSVLKLTSPRVEITQSSENWLALKNLKLKAKRCQKILPSPLPCSFPRSQACVRQVTSLSAAEDPLVRDGSARLISTAKFRSARRLAKGRSWNHGFYVRDPIRRDLSVRKL